MTQKVLYIDFLKGTDMQTIQLCAYGRTTSQGAWFFRKNHIVNRLYFVHAGHAVIRNAVCEKELFAGRLYLIPQCANFHPIDATDFDHTFFDYYSARPIRPHEIVELAEPPDGTAEFIQMIDVLLAHDPARTRRAAMEQFLSGFLSVLEESVSLPYITDAAVTRAVELIHADCAHVTSGALADTLHLNKSYFIRLFHAAMGVSPMKYIRSCRVLRAQELLAQGMRVQEAAELCGYASLSAFHKAVREELHCTPAQLHVK